MNTLLPSEVGRERLDARLQCGNAIAQFGPRFTERGAKAGDERLAFDVEVTAQPLLPLLGPQLRKLDRVRLRTGPRRGWRRALARPAGRSAASAARLSRRSKVVQLSSMMVRRSISSMDSPGGAVDDSD
jgi:hypothetical protein